MSTSPTPLLFPQALESSDDRVDLGTTYGLTSNDIQWLSHLKLASQVLRNQQSPPMLAEKILVNTGDLPSTLAGCFVLSTTPDDKGEILYTPYAGIKKFPSREQLTAHIKSQLDSASEDDDLLAFMSLAARKTLAAATDIKVTFETIDGEVFKDQRAAIELHQRINDQALIDELQKLPTLTALLDTVLDDLLKPAFPGLDQRLTQVGFYPETATGPAASPSARRRSWTHSVSLSEAVLSYYRHQRWPAGQSPEFFHPQKIPVASDQRHWEQAIKTTVANLSTHLAEQLQHYWNGASVDGVTRRAFFSKAILERARAQLLLKREDQVITAQQSLALHPLIEPTAGAASTLTLETVRLWEYEANYVELAGSLMISQGSSSAFLYTPARGIEVLKNYQDLKDTLRRKSIVAGHDDELYDLLSLEEKDRFIGFHEPHVSGAVITGSTFGNLFEAIIGKQLQNMEYALQVFRYRDGEVNIHALFDKGLDIRAMINEKLLPLDVDGRWSTRPALSGNQQPSLVLADTAAAQAKTLHEVQSLIATEFAAQPVDSLGKQKAYLQEMIPRLSHAFSVGVRAEASLRELSASLQNADWFIVDTVFNPDRADRKSRMAIKGFRPDAYSLVLESSGQNAPLPLAKCILLTQRGGLDVRHSGRAILWTPAAGLEVFDNVASARQQLDLRLLDPDKRLALLENLAPASRQFHQRYALNKLQLIEGNLVEHFAQSAIDHFLARSEHLRNLKLNAAQQSRAFKVLTQTGIDTNLRRAILIATAIKHQQSLPAWLGIAPVEEQRLHLELLEQYRNNVTDDKDYLHGMQTLEEYVRQTLTSLLQSRFPGSLVEPDTIEIKPNLALAGPAQTLTEFALNHVNIAQGTGFRIASTTTRPLPAHLDQSAVRQLLLSLNIQQSFAKQVTEALSGTGAAARKLRFVQQLPWQLLQHAHALKLQQRLSASAFDLISQVMDMPDAAARAAVAGAHAIVSPLEMIKTAGGAAIRALGLYLIGPGAGQQGPQILYAPYHAGPVFSEFANEASVVAAINQPGILQDLVIRRLPQNERTSFSNLFRSSIGRLSEITLATTPVEGNLLLRLFSDNTRLLSQLLGSQAETTGQPDWEAAKQLFSAGAHLISGLLPGKLAYGQFLWQSYLDFKDSAEALQDHHWTRAIRSFIAGAAQMVTLGRLSLQAASFTAQAAAETAPVERPLVAAQWSDVKPTDPARTALQRFEATTVALEDLRKNTADGTHLEPVSQHRYAALAGKVYRVAKPGAAWRMLKGQEQGPYLQPTVTRQLVLDPDVHTVHYGKALSTLHNKYATDYESRQVLNIEARGMNEIRVHHPAKAQAILQAVDLARFYAFNSLHNMAQLRQLLPGTRLDTFLKSFFGITTVDAALLDKIKTAITPICSALVDPADDLLNTDRFVVGSNKCPSSDLIAFVLEKDLHKTVHFTEKFFNPQLDRYKSNLTAPFDVDGHSQASVLLHELSHAYRNTLDIKGLEARRPFSDLIHSITRYSATLKQDQEEFQRDALSLTTPRHELFARWNSSLNSWVSLDSIPEQYHIGKEILELTKSKTMEDARNAFLDRADPAIRIDTILRNADSIAFLICEMGRQLDPAPAARVTLP